MQIDPKYFNTFLVIVALVAASLITFFTLQNRSNEKSAFKERIASNDSLQTVYWQQVQKSDSIRIADFKGNFVVLNFWANWSDATIESQQELATLKSQYNDTLQVIAAAVGLQKKEALDFIAEHKFPFHFVAGSRQFSDLSVPGLPAQLIFNPEGKLQTVFLGYQNESQYDSLRSLLSNGYK
ncbi:TlpA family protein disulfide reductase [Fodinibius saliphilus]|uniref:TlpA family protein disulfide reductase n=1 Tax=Fodinibius saliphilus TaxID=1920650 RepID=UPI001108E10D|nr:TlpA disulfide reductase family protein [Fodinibius saliphilus]